MLPINSRTKMKGLYKGEDYVRSLFRVCGVPQNEAVKYTKALVAYCKDMWAKGCCDGCPFVKTSKNSFQGCTLYVPAEWDFRG